MSGEEVADTLDLLLENVKVPDQREDEDFLDFLFDDEQVPALNEEALSDLLHEDGQEMQQGQNELVSASRNSSSNAQPQQPQGSDLLKNLKFIFQEEQQLPEHCVNQPSIGQSHYHGQQQPYGYFNHWPMQQPQMNQSHNFAAPWPPATAPWPSMPYQYHQYPQYCMRTTDTYYSCPPQQEFTNYPAVPACAGPSTTGAKPLNANVKTRKRRNTKAPKDGRTCCKCGIQTSAVWRRTNDITQAAQCNACYCYERKYNGKQRPRARQMDVFET